MTLLQAFYKQKEELHAAQREIKKLNKELEASRKGVASEKKFQEQLSHILGLNNKVSEYKNVSERYKDLYEREKAKVEELSDLKFSLELENLQLKERLKLFEDDTPSGQITELDEANAQIKALKDEVARLTAKINHNGSNTGLPTSKTSIEKKKIIPNSRKKSGKSKGGQIGHKKHNMPVFSDDEVTDEKIHTLNVCPKCGSSNLEESDISYHDEYDYEVHVVKRRHRFIEYTCLDCGSTVRAPLNGLVAPNQYGSTIQAMALSLINVGFVSINRTRKILSGFSPDDYSPCEGYLIKLQKRYSKKLKSFVADVKKHLIGVPLLYWDDTVIMVNKKQACLRFYGDDSVALYYAHEKKNKAGIDADKILPMLSKETIVMHDHNKVNYNKDYDFINAECNQHLL